MAIESELKFLVDKAGTEMIIFLLAADTLGRFSVVSRGRDLFGNTYFDTGDRRLLLTGATARVRFAPQSMTVEFTAKRPLSGIEGREEESALLGPAAIDDITELGRIAADVPPAEIESPLSLLRDLVGGDDLLTVEEFPSTRERINLQDGADVVEVALDSIDLGQGVIIQCLEIEAKTNTPITVAQEVAELLGNEVHLIPFEENKYQLVTLARSGRGVAFLDVAVKMASQRLTTLLRRPEQRITVVGVARLGPTNNFFQNLLKHLGDACVVLPESLYLHEGACTVDREKLAEHLSHFRRGEGVRLNGEEFINSKPVVFVEGLHVLDSPDVRKLFDYTIGVHVVPHPHGTIMRRVLEHCRKDDSREPLAAVILRTLGDVKETLGQIPTALCEVCDLVVVDPFSYRELDALPIKTHQFKVAGGVRRDEIVRKGGRHVGHRVKKDTYYHIPGPNPRLQSLRLTLSEGAEAHAVLTIRGPKDEIPVGRFKVRRRALGDAEFLPEELALLEQLLKTCGYEPRLFIEVDRTTWEIPGGLLQLDTVRHVKGIQSEQELFPDRHDLEFTTAHPHDVPRIVRFAGDLLGEGREITTITYEEIFD